jgi:hypothetical protein
MLKFTTHNLKKLETLFEELGYTVRYEKGNFQSGYCMVEDRKIAVVNKFFNTEGRINCLLDILSGIEAAETDISEKSSRLHKDIIKAREATTLNSNTPPSN